MIKLWIYPKCSTCQKAIKWLKAEGLAFESRHLVEEPLSLAQIKELHQMSGLPIKKFFNVSGMRYRELGLKDRLPGLSLDECYELLAGDGMLVKRPLAVGGGRVLLGFKEEAYAEAWK